MRDPGRGRTSWLTTVRPDVRVTGENAIRVLADSWVAKYGEERRFEVRPDGFGHPDGSPDTKGDAWVYGIEADAAFGFGKAPYSQTRWTFPSPASGA